VKEKVLRKTVWKVNWCGSKRSGFSFLQKKKAYRNHRLTRQYRTLAEHWGKRLHASVVQTHEKTRKCSKVGPKL